MKMKHKWSSYNSALMVLTFAILLPGATMQGLSQGPRNLVRSEILIDRSKPHVFLCEEKVEKLSEGKARIRFVNNSIWALQFPLEEVSEAGKTLVKLSNGSNVGALESGSLVSPIFRFETRTEQSLRHPRTWSSVTIPSYLRSGSFVRFEVPKQYFKNFDLYIEFVYEWELIGPLATESHGPKHRVYFGKTTEDDEINLIRCK